MPDLYQVIFTGALVSNVAQEQAVRDFAAVFKVPEEKAWRLVLSGTEHVLKKDIDRANANRYRQLLEEIGLVVRVEPMVSNGPAPAAGADGQADFTPAAASATRTGATAGGGWTPPPAADPRNPYAPPAADLTMPAAGGAGAFSAPHALPAGHGWTWITQGWALFKQAPLPWIGAVLLYFLIVIVVGLLPFIGSLITNLFGPVLLGGFMYAADRQASGQGFAVGNIFYGFTNRMGSLVAIGAIYLGAIISLVLVFALIFGVLMAVTSGFDATAIENNPEQAFAAMGPVGVLLFLLVMLALFPLIMAYWFAPALVLLNGQGPIAAMKLSFQGCLRNMLPLLVFGLAMTALMLIGMIPVFLGLLVVIPVGFAGNYAAYREIFYGPRSMGAGASAF